MKRTHQNIYSFILNRTWLRHNLPALKSPVFKIKEMLILLPSYFELYILRLYSDKDISSLSQEE